MTKTYYVSSGNIEREVETDSPLDAAKAVVGTCEEGASLGFIIRVSDKGFNKDRNPWYVATEVVIKAIGHKLEKL